MRLGLLIASIVLVADQLTKYIMVEMVFRPDGVVQTPFFTRQLIEILPFFQFRLIWNSGISFSLFNSGEATTIATLVGFQLVIVGVLLWWLRQAETRMIGIGIGFIVVEFEEVADVAIVDRIDLVKGNGSKILGSLCPECYSIDPTLSNGCPVIEELRAYIVDGWLKIWFSQKRMNGIECHSYRFSWFSFDVDDVVGNGSFELIS